MTAVSSYNVIESTCLRPWEVAVQPFPIIDRIFYVGNKWVGAYLIDTGDGLILLDTTTAETAYLLVDSIYKLGYRPQDIKKIFLSHAHVDHFGAASMIKGLSGAEIWLSGEDDIFRKTDGAAEIGGLDIPFREYEYNVDRHYDYETPFIMGEVVIHFRLTPGHTPGCVSFFIDINDKKYGKLTAAMHGGVGVLTMTDDSLRKAGLPVSLRRQFIEDCEKMSSCPVDICLPSHPAHGTLFQAARKNGADDNPFINRGDWAAFLKSRAEFAVKIEEESRKN